MAEQYRTDENLRIRIETHRLYGVGPGIEESIDAVLRLKEDESLLDVGTGPGVFLHRLRREGHRGKLTGVDASAGMIEKARKTEDGVEFLQGDAQKLPFADGAFDVVTARHMLYHVPDIGAALAEARRVLRRGGKFLAVTNYSDFMSEYWEAVGEAARELRGDSAQELARMLKTSSGDRFTEKNGPGFIWEAFGNARMVLVKSALRFETAEPVLRYFDSCRTLRNFSIELWRPAREAMEVAVKRRLESEPWVVSKIVVLFRAVKD